MAFADNLPISESVGIFVGVSGFEWLVDGQADPLNAGLVALGSGFVILLLRLLTRRKR